MFGGMIGWIVRKIWQRARKTGKDRSIEKEKQEVTETPKAIERKVSPPSSSQKRSASADPPPPRFDYLNRTPSEEALATARSVMFC